MLDEFFSLLSQLPRLPSPRSERFILSSPLSLSLFQHHIMSYLPPRLRTLADVISFSNAEHASSRALVCCSGGPAFSRQQLAAAVADATESLRALGVSPGDVVTIVDVNTVRVERRLA